MTRRAFWLKTWEEDYASKNKLFNIHFDGNLLFGPELEKVLERSADKTKGFPFKKKTRQKEKTFFVTTGEKYRRRMRNHRPNVDGSSTKIKRKPTYNFQAPCLPANLNDASSTVGARLLHFLPQWQEFCSNHFILQIIAQGYKIEFM